MLLVGNDIAHRGQWHVFAGVLALSMSVVALPVCC